MGRRDGRAAGRAGRPGGHATPSRAATPATRRARPTPRRWPAFAARALGLGRARGRAHGARARRDARRRRDAQAGHRAGRRGGGQPARSTRRSTGSSRTSTGASCEAPLGADGRLDLDALETRSGGPRAAGGRAAYLLCSPHNPTGTVHTRRRAGRRRRARRPARRAGGRRRDPRAAGRWRTRASCRTSRVPGAENGLSLMSASKAWNLAGLKAAVVVAGPGAAGDLARMPEEVGHGPSHVGVIAHTAACREGGAGWTPCSPASTTTAGCSPRCSPSTCPASRYRPRQATYLAWLDCRALGLGDDPAAVFLERGRVALNSGTGLRHRRSRARPAESGHLAGDHHRSGAADGRRRRLRPSRRGRRRTVPRDTAEW